MDLQYPCAETILPGHRPGAYHLDRRLCDGIVGRMYNGVSAN